MLGGGTKQLRGREVRMRSCWIVSAILAIAPAAASFAQQSHLDTRQQIEQMVATFAERYNKQDVAAIASMFTTDAVRVSSAASAVGAGPQAIEEIFKTQFAIGFSHIHMIVDQVSPLGTDTAIAIGEYQLTGQGQSAPLKVDGHWTEVGVREGGAWKIRLLTVVPTPSPGSNAVTPSTETNSAGADTSTPGAQKAAILINIDKGSQRMTVFFRRSRKI